MAVVLPLIVNIRLHISIFIHIRHSSNRIQSHSRNDNSVSNINNREQQSKISRRDVSLLKNMFFIFAMFVFGWTPIFVINIVDFLNRVNFVIVMFCVYLCAACILGIIIYLFLCNHEARKYLYDCIRNIF